MDLVTTILIAIGLAADAFAVSVARSMVSKKLHLRHSLAMAFSFGFFQALMPVLGWFTGIQLMGPISGIDHWIAFALLAFVGGRMIYGSQKMEKEGDSAFDGRTLLMLSIATSIDALAVGLSLSLLEVSIFVPALIIGAVTFAISLAGSLAGRRFGHLFESKIEIAGGLILIGIGLKILFEHLGLLTL